MQTILGSGGVIGNNVALSLPKYTKKVRLVSRKPKKVVGNEELFKADLLKYKQAKEAVKGSEVVYLTVGVKFKTKIWQKQWPVIIQNVIDACKEYQAKLVYLDNTYMYGKVQGWMTERTPFNPAGPKGEISAQMATRVLEEIRNGNLKALIARSADFYGPKAFHSYLNLLISERVAFRRPPLLFYSSRLRHAYTYAPDAGLGMAMLGNTPSAFGQTWHLPTDHRVPTGAEYVKMAGDEMFLRPKYKVLNQKDIEFAAYFNPLIKESLEILGQFEGDYLFDSSKFLSQFKFEATTYMDGFIDLMNEYPLA